MTLPLSYSRRFPAEQMADVTPGSPRGSRRSGAREPTFLLERIDGGGGWIRTTVGVLRQIYSLLPLSTRPHLHETFKEPSDDTIARWPWPVARARGWSRHPDLNRGPTDYKSVALPAELCRPESPRPPGADFASSRDFRPQRVGDCSESSPATQAFSRTFLAGPLEGSHRAPSPPRQAPETPRDQPEVRCLTAS